ncbi:competence protein CoiA family protein [Streptococcaceae bacterium ESL0687]|nr:competence protein CoiA family protein [Streptococcaceae bacterium ESL0687]
MIVGEDSKGKRINLVDFTDYESLKNKSFFCPHCHSSLIFKNGPVKNAHFAHKSLKECNFYWENESQEHLGLKKSLYAWFSKDNQAQVEFYLPEIKQIADIMVEERLAIEIQCSSLSLERLRERTSSYQEIGVTVIWILGQRLHLRNKLTELKENFLYFSSNIGFYYWELDYEGSFLRINYLIHVDIKGRVIYRSQKFPFGRGNLMQILRFPYQARRLESIKVRPLSKEEVYLYLRRQLLAKNSRWMKVQELYYLKGKNILAPSLLANFYFPPAFDYYKRLLKREEPCHLAQTRRFTKEIEEYYKNYFNYLLKIKKSGSFLLYPPKFYDRMNFK